VIENTVPKFAVPPAQVVPYSTPVGPTVRFACAAAPSPSLPVKLWSTVSVQAPPGAAGGFSSNTVPQPKAPKDVHPEPDAALPPYSVVPYSDPFLPSTRLATGRAPSPFCPVKL